MSNSWDPATPGEGTAWGADVVQIPGPAGPPGPPGPPPILAIGSVVESLSPTVTLTPVSEGSWLMSFGLQKGNPGDQGPAGEVTNLTIGTVTTGAPGSNAQVTLTGTGLNKSLNFTIPRGNAGTNGAPGSVIYSGSGAPTSGLGIAGDFYIDTTNAAFWGPKTVSGWPGSASFSMIGTPKRSLLTRTSNQAVGAWPVKLQFQAVTQLNVSGTWTVANPSRIVVPAGVSYASLVVQVEVDGGATAGTLSTEVMKNGVALVPRVFNNSGRNTTSGSAVNVLTDASYEIPVSPGDYLEVEVNIQSLTSSNIIGTGVWCQVRFS